MTERGNEVGLHGIAEPEAAPTDEFLARLLRSLRRAGHCSGIPLSRGRSKQYGDIIRALEKRIVRERYP